jgi:hypothetical protein
MEENMRIFNAFHAQKDEIDHGAPGNRGAA